jgi:multiple sugar transport system permease protein
MLNANVSITKYWRLYLAEAMIVIICLIALIPFFWMLLTSLKTASDLLQAPNALWFRPSLENYQAVIDRGIGHFFRNSVINATGATLLAMLIGVPAAYALARVRFRGDFLALFSLIGLRFVPFIAIVLPMYFIMIRLGLVGTHIGIILAYQIIVLPLMIWIVKSFFETIPFDLEEAALVDGCTRAQAFRMIALPLVAPAVGTVAILGFIMCWNEFFIAMIFGGRNVQPLTVGIQAFAAQEYAGAQFGPLSAWGAVTSIPIVIVAMLLSKYLVSGLGGVDES